MDFFPAKTFFKNVDKKGGGVGEHAPIMGC